ncbi:MAG: hypothetical protein L6R38_006356 [Xanthoria sp. 2 TBL-2021]|nr:MAG: hypothetical protein L6R38_006356 [Xanthoria sp. 2 TBL-2021]
MPILCLLLAIFVHSHGEWYIREGASLVPAPPDLHDINRAQAIFVDALRKIQEAASKALQRPVQIASVSVPQHFNDSSTHAVIEALKEVEPSYKQPWQVIKSVAATWLAYGLYTCEAFGLNHDTCDIDEDSHRVLIVEYRETYLQVFIAVVGAKTCSIGTRVRYSNLGENAILDAADHANREGRIQKILRTDDSDAATTIKKKHYAKIENTLSDFLMERESTSVDPDWWDIVRAVVISGDASESGLQRLRSCVDGALGQHKDKMQDSIHPLYVEAMGAAQRGRHQILNPRFLDDIIVSPNIFVEHDEL